MSDFLSLITPHTTGIIWLPAGEINLNDPYYKSVDYILNGLLTAGIEQLSGLNSQVIIGKNFNHPIYVLIAKDLVPKELASFYSLFEKELKLESKILVIDEKDKFDQLQKHSSKDIIPRFQLVK